MTACQMLSSFPPMTVTCRSQHCT